MTLTTIGTFQVKSDVLIVSDPCYTSPETFGVIVDSAYQGTWTVEVDVQVDSEGWNRTCRLIAFRSDGSRPVAPYTQSDSEAGVDSGNMGMFCETIYPVSCHDHVYYKNFTDECFGKHDHPAKIVRDCGVSASAGWGDGSYPVHILRDATGKCFCVEVVFIEDINEDPDYIQP